MVRVYQWNSSTPFAPSYTQVATSQSSSQDARVFLTLCARRMRDYTNRPRSVCSRSSLTGSHACARPQLSTCTSLCRLCMNLHVTTKTHASAFIKLLGCSNARHERCPQAIVRGVWTGASALHAEGVQSRRESESSRRRRQLRRARARRRFLVLVSNQLQVQGSR